MDKLRIIIAENDVDEQDFLREGFESSKHFEIAAIAFNANELFSILERSRRVPPDLVLTDLNMEGQTGYDVLRFISADPEYSKIPVIVYSGSLLDSVVTKCMELGARQVVMKPSSLDGYQKFPSQLYEILTNP